MNFNEEMQQRVGEFNANAHPEITAMVDDDEDYTAENNALEFADEIFSYVMNELMENHEDWYFRFQGMTVEERKMLFTALSDAFGDTTED
jgi:hypothetical protein